MRLGIDLGTTRVVTAYVDRGNYPVVVFDAPGGGSSDWYPPLIAVRGEERLYGWNAWQTQEEPDWTILRSVKRFMEEAGPETRIQVAGQSIPMQQLLTELVQSLKDCLLGGSNLPVTSKSEPLEVMLGVPANANSNQRFLTVEAFRQAGFQVLGLLNEPSAASVEFGHRNRKTRSGAASSRLLVYDLGGGTFDASLVDLGETTHEVVASEGIGTLGGDDFDEVLADLALETAGIDEQERNGLSQAEMFRLHEECRQKKEALHPNTRRLAVDLAAARESWPEVSLTTDAFYERCRPLIQETLHAVEDLLAAANGRASSESAGGEPRLEALYVTGGASELPLVSRILRDEFGGRVKRSAYTHSATAIGLAIQADAQAGYRLSEKFTRYFGVWREAEGGRAVVFDPLFVKGTSLPAPGDPPLERSRRYAAVHNVGHYRYLECSHLTEEGRPAGEITVWDDIRFPFDASLRGERELKSVAVTRLGNGTRVEAEERYRCDAGGSVTVSISSLTGGYDRSYRLGRWSAEEPPVVPGKRKTARPRAARKKTQSK
jgi:molecular chaperone DnaK (HSP70)